MRAWGISYNNFTDWPERKTLLCSDESGGTGDALPGLILLDPCVNEACAVDVRLAFLDSLYAKDSYNDGSIAINLNAYLLVDSLRGADSSDP